MLIKPVKTKKYFIIEILFLALFLLPYIVLFFKTPNLEKFDLQGLWWAVQISFVQSLVVSLVLVVLSVFLALGLFNFSTRIRIFFTKILFFPQIIPTFYSVLILYTIFYPFPVGSGGVVIAIAYINLGLSTLIIYQAILQKLGQQALLAEVYSVSKYVFFKKVLFQNLKPEIFKIVVLSFLFTMTSFSVPLLVGGGKTSNLEILAFEKVFIDQDWSSAFYIFILQVIMIYTLSFVSSFRFKNYLSFGDFDYNVGYLKSNIGALLVLFYTGSLFFGYLVGLTKSFVDFDFFLTYQNELWQATKFTMSNLFIYLVLCAFMLYIWLAYYIKTGKQLTASNWLVTPSILLAFTCYLVFNNTKYANVGLSLALVLAYFSFGFKIFLEGPLNQAAQQIETSKIYGLSISTIIFKVLYRQKKSIFIWFNYYLIMSFLSDFAITRAAGFGFTTLGTFAAGLLGGYRTNQSYLMSLYILCISVLVMCSIYFIMKGIDVFNSKFKIKS